MMEELDLDPLALGQDAICSFDEASAQLMICCPPENILQKPKLLPQPRYNLEYFFSSRFVFI